MSRCLIASSSATGKMLFFAHSKSSGLNTSSGFTVSGGGGEHQRSARGPLHLEQVRVRHPDGQNRVGLQQRVDVDQTFGSSAHKQVPADTGQGQRPGS